MALALFQGSFAWMCHLFERSFPHMCHLYPFVGFVEVVLFCGCILDKRRLMFVYAVRSRTISV